MSVVTRFAPSPTGALHLGHAYSAWIAQAIAQREGGRFLLRIEDVDHTRARAHWEEQIYDDMAWLGLTWELPVMRQSERGAVYRAALEKLWERGLLYPCTCTRRDIDAALSAPQEGAQPIYGPDGPVYPGTCRAKSSRNGPMPEGAALRLDMGRAVAGMEQIAFDDNGTQHAVDPADMVAQVGDVVLSRKDFLGSYHLSVVLDDAEQGVTDVVRGRDLFAATPIHVVLQQLLGLDVPRYHHHALVRDDQGKRLAKRDDARAIAAYREDGLTPDDVRALALDGAGGVGW